MKKFFVALIGSTVLLLGVAMLILPGPGVLVMAAGVALLATEFVWARRVWRKAKGAVARARRKSGLREWLRHTKEGRNKNRERVALGRKNPAT